MAFGDEPLDLSEYREQYRAADWPSGRAPDGWGLWLDFHVVPLAFDGWDAKIVQVFRESARRSVLLLRAGSRGDSGRIATITIVESPSIVDAHEALLEDLANNMAEVVPASTRGLDVGDVAYTDGGNEARLVMFARDNLTVRVGSTGPHAADPTPLATAIDSAIVRPYSPVAGAGPLIEVFVVPASAVAGRPAPIDLSVRRASGRGGGEQPIARRLRSGAGPLDVTTGRIQLIPQRAGSHTVTLTAITGEGGASVASSAILVT